MEKLFIETNFPKNLSNVMTPPKSTINFTMDSITDKYNSSSSKEKIYALESPFLMNLINSRSNTKETYIKGKSVSKMGNALQSELDKKNRIINRMKLEQKEADERIKKLTLKLASHRVEREITTGE